MTGFLGVGLVALEVVDGSAYLLSCTLARANRMHFEADHLQRLERYHDLVIFSVIPNQHQNLARHSEPPRKARIPCAI
jgi:hypothetical protein